MSRKEERAVILLSPSYLSDMITLTLLQKTEYLSILEEFGKRQSRSHLEGVCGWSALEAKQIINRLIEEDVSEQV